MTFTEKRAVDEFLCRVLTVVETSDEVAKRIVAYKRQMDTDEYWTDALVAECLGGNATAPSVRNIRQECHGQTKRTSKSGVDQAEIEKAIGLCEKRMESQLHAYKAGARTRMDILEARIVALESDDAIDAAPSLSLPLEAGDLEN